MRYEPGTSDISTTLDPPEPAAEDTVILANLFRNRMLTGAGLSKIGEETWRLSLPGGHYIYLVDPAEVAAVYRAMQEHQAGKQRWQEQRRD